MLEECKVARVAAGSEAIDTLSGGRFAGLRRAPVAQPGPAHALPCDLVEVCASLPHLRLDPVYASKRNFLHRPLYTQGRVFLQAAAAQALEAAAHWFAARGLGLLVYDGYRPWSVTRAMYEEARPEWRAHYLANPATGSNHNRAAAVDLSLCRLDDGLLLPMPSGFDEFSERAWTSYAGGTDEERRLRDFLQEGMHAAGFRVLASEWWHFDYGEVARYESLDASFEDILACLDSP